MRLHKINDLQAHSISKAVNRIVEMVEALDVRIAVTECANNRTPHAVMVSEVSSTVNKAREYLNSGLYYDEVAFNACMESLNYWLTNINDAIIWGRKRDADLLTQQYEAYLHKYGWTKTAPIDTADFYTDDEINKPS